MTEQTQREDIQPHYGLVFVILALFTAMEIGLAYLSGLPDTVKVAVLIFLAALKVGLVLFWFMHLKFDNRFFGLPFALGLVLVVPLILIVTITLPEDNNTTTSSNTSGSGQQTITAVETSYSIELSADSVPAGTITFQVENDADNLPHQFTIAKTDLAPGDLPLSGGTVDESQLDIVGKTDPLRSGASSDLTVDLSAGHYVLFCNLPGHYQQGMYIGFTVTTVSESSGSPQPTETLSATQTPESASANTQTANIVLNSYWIAPAPATLQAGDITFQIENQASDLPHQITVVQTDTSANELPTTAGGDVDLSQLTIIDQTEDVPPHQSVSLSVNLSAGHYVLISDISGDYYQGMYADLSVVGE